MYPGTDIIEISRFKGACQRNPRITQRLFTQRELNEDTAKSVASLAVRFAGKEAVLKALGTGLRGLSWHDIEIISNEMGEPEVYLSPKARDIALSRGAEIVKVSLSHSKDLAIAVAILGG